MLIKGLAIVGFIAVVFTAGCQLGAPEGGPTPTVGDPVTETPDVIPTPSVTSTQAAPTLPIIPQLESPTPTYTPGPPTETFTPSPTPGPFEYVIQQNDTLIYILRQFGYTELNVINDVLALNPLLTSADRLPPPGSTILIPRPSPTVTPEGYDLTQALLPPQVVIASVAENAQIVEVAVREGETILGVAEQNSTTLVVLATLNPQLGFFGCDFRNPSGGPDCNVPLQVGELVNVPALTPTPTLSPTFSGNETATPTPTYPPPAMVFPPQNASASARTFLLQWVSVGILAPNEVYLVQIEDVTAGTTHIGVTRTTSYELPSDMIPSDGQSHNVRWRVSVAAPNEQGTYRIISGDATWREFRWG